MKVLVIGLGSMGQRRIRCLESIGGHEIYAYDKLESQALKLLDKDIALTNNRDILFYWLKNEGIELMLVCTPPGTKQEYIGIANRNGIKCFIEADIQSYLGLYYPSRTLVYHPAIQRIKELLDVEKIGKIYTFNYHMGQHIRDWHKGADYSNYYAAKKETGACKEMVVFELAWLHDVLGAPIELFGSVDKRLNDEQITADDVYSLVARFVDKRSIYDDFISGTMLIDVVSRPAVRELTIIGEKGTLRWNWADSFIYIHTERQVIPIAIDRGENHEGYNENIPEQMYVDELKALIAEQEEVGTYGYYKSQEENIIQLAERVW
jgi:predicted dehydrogenase